MKLVTVGTVAFDSIETPFGKVDRVIGGAATYISLAASHFIEELGLVSVVGDDFPDAELEFLKGKNINLEGLDIKEGEKSFFWAGRYHDNMNKRDTLDTQLNVLADFDPVLPESYRNADFLMLGNLTPEIQLQVINQMNKKPRLVVMDTMNFWMDIAMPVLKDVIQKVDVLTINDEEARQLSGEYSLVKAAALIHKMGPNTIVIKKGEHGALLFHNNEMFYAPALPLAQVFDPTGAGDTFAGGFIGYLAQQEEINFENLKRAVIYGSVLASFCVEEFSIARLKTLKREEIEKRLMIFENLTKFTV